MSNPGRDRIRTYQDFLLNQSNAKRVTEQKHATALLFEGFNPNVTESSTQPSQLKNFQQSLSEATEILIPNPVQQKIYHADTGTHVVPEFFVNMLANVKSTAIVRPGTIDDARKFVKWAYDHKINYTIRGAGTYPFGGSVPLNGDYILDLSCLDFMHVDSELKTLTVGAGVIFANARKHITEHGFDLIQEISNPNSGTITGWIATGGIGLGSYKYGHVKNSVLVLYIITPDGKFISVTPKDESFENYFGSEGQFGVIAGATLKIRKDTYVTKPYALSFKTTKDAWQFMNMLRESGLKPTSVIYFSESYIRETYHIEKTHLAKHAAEALEAKDHTRLTEIQQDKDVVEGLKEVSHIVVLHFDEQLDYQQALKSRLFGTGGEHRRVNHLSFQQLPTPLAHLLWNHRFLSVQMKQVGPSLLVSETTLPFSAFPEYQEFLENLLKRILNIELKSEAHLLPNDEILVQSIFKADTRTFRHKAYFALVPMMSATAHHFGAKPYGIGIWNYPSLNEWKKHLNGQLETLLKFKKTEDPHSQINQGKFLNPKGQKYLFKLFRVGMPAFMNLFVETYHKRLQKKRIILAYPFEKSVWTLGKIVFRNVIPPGLKAHTKKPIADMIAVCAECDSCERVCPTSDVFGLYGPATPITRRRTARRLASGEEISRQEALGFLACTRCGNCTDVCPTNIPFGELFDAVEAHPKFQQALGFTEEEKADFIERFWQIMKDSSLYKAHTLADQKNGKSHLAHGIKIVYNKGFEYSELAIDPETCIHCGMCSDENACMYNARQSQPRQIPDLVNVNCALCNACVNFCPQNKIAQQQRLYFDKLVSHAVDLEEKRYWINQQNRIHDTTKVQRSISLTEMADRYVTEEIIMEIDKEASTGQIPVSGSGQGDRHMGIGFDAERFAHFHIVGPAQNRLHEGDPDEELSVILGKREDFCKFDRGGNLQNPKHPNIKLMTPILFNDVRLESNGKVELAFIKVAEALQSLVVIPLERLLEDHSFILQEGQFQKLPPVIIPRVGYELINRLIVNPHTNREFLTDLWQMPVVEVEYHPNIDRTLKYIRDSVAALNKERALISGYLEISEHDLIGSLSLTTDIKEKVNHFLDQGVDILHLHGLRNKDHYFVTSRAVRALHHYLMRIGRRHEVSIIASGGIRLASDTQKTIQRGAEATLIDFAALLALDPSAYRAIIEEKATTEKLLSLDVDWAVKRLKNQAESRKVQILEVLGASGFKDLKKTVGEEGRLIDFHKLENRIQRSIFEDDSLVTEYTELNQALILNKPVSAESACTYSELRRRIQTVPAPHDFYRLGNANQRLYKRDFVWPGQLIESLGRMASGELMMLDFNHVAGTGLLGDGFDVMKILYNKDPMNIPDSELEHINTALPLKEGLTLKAPWMFGGKSVGSVGLDTWKAHVTAVRELGIQYDTGEGGYPTCFFLNSKGEPIFFTENEIKLIKPYFRHNRDYTIQEIKQILNKHGVTERTHPQLYEKIKHFPSLKPFHFTIIVDKEDEPFISTEMKTGLFGVSKESIKRARRVVIAYSQGAKMGIGGHILAKKVNKLVSYMRGVEGLEQVNIEKVEKLFQRLKKIQQKAEHPLRGISNDTLPVLDKTGQTQETSDELKNVLFRIQEQAYELNAQNKIDPIDFEQLIRLCEEIIEYSYSSIISPFPFHNCYSIEDVKAFIDVVRMINPQALVCIKVSPSIDIEFIAAGLARIAKDNTTEIVKAKFGSAAAQAELTSEMTEYAQKFGMQIEIWLDGPRGGTGASPNIIKGQMGMHLEYAIPLIHNRLVKDGLRNYVNFIVSGGMRTYEDVIKAVALGADGVIWGTAPLVAIGCDRNRNCHDGCSRGIATSNLILQKLRDVDVNTRQIINAFTMIQMQVMRALAALGFSDLRELRGRFDKIHWIGLKERVDHRFRIRNEVIKEIEKDEQLFRERRAHITGQTNCGVAAINGTVPIPAHILDNTLQSMRNRGMDGVGVAKTMCFPEHLHEYAYRVLVKHVLQQEVEARLLMDAKRKNISIDPEKLREQARRETIEKRSNIMQLIKTVFLDPCFEYHDTTNPARCRESYKPDEKGDEYDYREFGNDQTDPGDIFCFFLRVKSAVLQKYIEQELLHDRWSRFLKQLFPNVTKENYKKNQAFMNKAEDLFVFNHSRRLTRILYVSTILPAELEKFAHENETKINLYESEIFADHNDSVQKTYLTLLRDFISKHQFEHHKHRYGKRTAKIAAVMSCGKNFALWKTAGNEIPWQTPDAPNNIIHVRLATGSVVEQMNSHPFGKLHTALTHNGETTNYEALKQRVEQFDLSPLADTDTEVASLKFHLTADEWEYPDWAIFESLSPTTGDDLQLIDPEIRGQLEEVQRVEFTSSPDGPYQYLCLRHNPYKNTTERIDLKDPADLRPNVSAIWQDGSKVFNIISSEEHAIHSMLQSLDEAQLIEGAVADQTFVSSGMISRYFYDETGQIQDFEFIDRYGKKMVLAESGTHYSLRHQPLKTPLDLMRFENWQDQYQEFFRGQLAELSFDDFRWLLAELVKNTATDHDMRHHLTILTWLRDNLRSLNPGDKAQSSLIDIAQHYLNSLLDKTREADFKNYEWCDRKSAAVFDVKPTAIRILVIDAADFLAEGVDPDLSLGAFLKKAYEMDWRTFIIYRTRGQRLISPAVMGSTDTDDVTMDVYGAVGEYFGAFMQGGLVRLHGNAQNFCAMCMHHGEIYVFGNAGKVCGYASKGGKVVILGNVVDRCWTNSVNDSRTQDLEISILGSATKYAGESLMGGNFFFGGLHFDHKGQLCLNERPYLGTKMLGGASRGNFIFFDPENRLVAAQYVHGKIKEFTEIEWRHFYMKITETYELANIPIRKEGGESLVFVEGKNVKLSPENFKLIVPKGGLKGYESH